MRAILTSIREKLVAEKMELLGNVVIGEVSLKSKISKSELDSPRV